MMIGELIGHAGNFFLGFCVMLGAAFVFQRSKRAALWVALGGLCYALAVPIEWFIGRAGIAMALSPMTINLFYSFVNMGRHVVFFGGLALGMRTIAQESA